MRSTAIPPIFAADAAVWEAGLEVSYFRIDSPPRERESGTAWRAGESPV